MKLKPHVKYLLNHGRLKFIGERCTINQNHIGLRYTKGNKCVECVYMSNNDVEAEVAFAWVKDEQQSNLFLVPIEDFAVDPAPISDARKNRSAARKAASKGKRFFHGSKCRSCGCTLRFASTTSCVACEKLAMATSEGGRGLYRLFTNPQHNLDFIEGRFLPIRNMAMDRYARWVASSFGSRVTTYTGFPCDCGNTERYVKRGQCTCCVKQRNGSRKKKAAPVKTETANFDHLF